MSVQRRCEQIAMNCGSYRAHEESDRSPGSCLDCAHYDANRHSCVPVSYTHLDVYKRQAVYMLPLENKNRAWV